MKKTVLFSFILLVFTHINTSAQVGVNATGNPPHPSAGLDVDFSDKGFLLPRISEAQRDAISNPPAGLMVYNIDSQCLEVRMPLGWRELECNCSSYPSSAFTQPVALSFDVAADFSANTSGATYAWTFQDGSPATSTSQNPSVTWAAGGTYSVALTVTNNLGCSSTTTGSVDVSSYPPSTPSLVCQSGYNITAAATTGYLGCISFSYRGSNVTYTTVRSADGKEWLRQDLGSSGVGSYGDLFQWGRWDDGHQERSPGFLANGSASPNNPTAFTSTPDGPNRFYWHVSAGAKWWAGGSTTDTWTGATPADISSSNGMDPCKQLLGSAWRVPSGGNSGEWATAFTAENITGQASASSSNLRLASGGFRYSEDPSLWTVGTSGYYWSSTPHPSQSGRAKNIAFWNGGYNVDLQDERGYGFSIRCLR